MQPQIILLKEGTDTSQGKPQLISNINACMAVVDAVRSTLGPRGMDKLVIDNRGTVTISNDGATLMKKLEIVHPAAKVLVDISLSQDAEVGDGTTSVVLLAGEFLKAAKPFIEEGVHPQVIIRSYRQAGTLAVAELKAQSIDIGTKDEAKQRHMLVRCAMTSMNSKLVSEESEFFANLVVDAVSVLDAQTLDLNMIGIKKVQGGGLRDSFLVKGVAFKKTFSYAGFEMQPRSFNNPKVLLLNIELELKAEKENAEIRLDDPSKYQSIVDAEWEIIYQKLRNCADSGAKIVLSRLAIGDLGTQFFADRDIFCAGRVAEEDLQRVAQATGAAVQTTVNGLDSSVLGTCERFQEAQVGSERYNLFTGCPKARTATFVLRGGSEQFLDEADRSLHDAIMIVRRAVKNSSVVAGGGAIDMEVSTYLRDQARNIAGRGLVFVNAYAKALEVIPRQLCDNAGFDATDVLSRLRNKHSQKDGKGKHFGIDIETGDMIDTFESFVWEPSVVKTNAITAATEAACLVLSVDATVTNPRSEAAEAAPGINAGMGGRAGMMGGRGRGRGRGRGMRR